MKTVYIFSDSSTLNNGQNNKYPDICSTGFYGVHPDYRFERAYIVGSMDINRAELLGLLKSLEYIIDYKKCVNDRIIIISDNQYAVKSVTVWISNWIKNQRNGVFYSSKNKPVENQDLIKKIYNDYISKYNISVYHINSHTSENKIKEFHSKFNRVNNCNIDLNTYKILRLGNEKIDKLVGVYLSNYIDKYYYTNSLYINF